MTLLSHSLMFAGAACLAACSSVSPTPPAEAPKVAAEASKPAAPRPPDSRGSEQTAPSASSAAESPAPPKAKTPTPPKPTVASSSPKAPTAAHAVTAPKAPAAATAPEASAAKAAPVAQASAPKPAPLNLKTLEQRLKDTNAIGVLTKLSLKNQVDDLVGQFRAYHDGRRPPTLTELRPGFELLLMKVLSLLQDKDSALAHDINASRDAIWTVLADKQKFAEFS